MKISKYILPTQKEDPSDAVVLSHKLMVRAGLIRKEAAGMYVYLPLGLRVLQRIMGIVREEMNDAGALEFLMPELTNAELWKESGRWSKPTSSLPLPWRSSPKAFAGFLLVTIIIFERGRIFF